MPVTLRAARPEQVESVSAIDGRSTTLQQGVARGELAAIITIAGERRRHEQFQG